MSRLILDDTTNLGGIDIVAEVKDPNKITILGFEDLQIDIMPSGVNIISGILPDGYTKHMLNNDDNILKYMLPECIRM